MQLEIDILSISNLIAIIISGFLAFHFLFLYTSNWKANVFLGIFLLLTSLSVGIAEIESVNNQQIWSPTLGFLLSPILFSAILFHYVLASTKTLGSKWRKSFWMFLVAFIFSAINLSITEIAEEETLRVVSSIVFLTSELISLIILVLIMREIKAHNRNILRLFSTLENKQLNWLKMLIIVNISFTGIWFIDDLLVSLVGENIISSSIAIFSTYATLITILWIGFAGLRQAPIFEEISLGEESYDLPILILDDHLEEKYEKMNAILLEEKLYADQELTLSDLAKMTELRPKELSMLINKQFKSSFYHYINYHRINYFKIISTDPNYNYLSIEGLSQEAGFKSKSTFYAAFKRIEGTTPKDYEVRRKGSSSVSQTSSSFS